MFLIRRCNPGTEGSPARARRDWVRWTLPLSILIVSFAATYHPDAWDTLHFNRESILDGEVYRLLTFHFVHITSEHFVINAITLAAVWLLYGRTMRMHEWISAIVGCGCLIGLGLLLLSPGVGWTAGLSGLLYALFACASIRSALSGEFWSWAIVVFLVVKIVLEQTVGPNVDMERFIGSPVLVEAHMIGVIGGILLGIVLKKTCGQTKLSRRRTLGMVTGS